MSYISISYTKDTYQGIVYEVKENYFLFNSKGEKLYVYDKQTDYEIGDILTIHGAKEELDFVTLESCFDFNNYLQNKGVNHSVSADKITKNFSNPLRLNSFKNDFLNHFDDDTKGLIKAILFSESNDENLNHLSKELHLSKLLSTGGVYLSFFLSFFTYLLSIKIKTKYSKIIAIGILSIYGVFIFPKFALLKILFLSIIKWINEYKLNKKYNYLTILSFSGILFLLFDYHLAYQDCFILGYLIPIVSYFLLTIFKRKKKLVKKLSMYFLIYLFFIPFELKYDNKINLFSFPLQILLTPIFIGFALVSLLSFFHLPFYNLVKHLKNLIAFILKLANPLNIGIIAPSFNQYGFLLYYLVFAIFIYYFSIGFKPIYKTILFLSVSCLVMYFIPINNSITNEVNFVNVGQGDCCIIRNKQKVTLIDVGGLTYKDIATDCLIPKLRKMRIYKIDTIIITHNDSDHCGALDSLKDNIKINQVIKNPESFPIKVGEITYNNYNYCQSDDDNESSLVIGFSIIGKSFLITGDAPTKIENEIMSQYAHIPCDILKVGHHGSNTSTSDRFIKYLSPKEGVISVGKGNKYGHPNDKVISILKNNNVKIRRTDLEGTITYKNYIFI